MKDMDEKTLTRLITEALQIVPEDEIYSMSLKHMNFEAIKENPPHSEDDIGKLFTTAGFVAGIEFSLRYLDITDETDSNETTMQKEEPKAITIISEDQPKEEPIKYKLVFEGEPPTPPVYAINDGQEPFSLSRKESRK